MITIDNLELEHLITQKFKQVTQTEVQVSKEKLNALYGTNQLLYADTDSTKVVLVSEPSSDVSRETLQMDKQDAEILIEIARKIDVECGQVGCTDCMMYTDKERYQTNCLLSQLNYVRRKYSDREE